uniref:sushi repeat-containing protein SRPX2-like isoform X2 n=1 Tax=Oncorhynchus gorbuscha TaxID=8017 RepID=UPI001EAF34E5|nr:sushi repeat-containing protein SRPX2-like isoform X2 [Oncorhynchus gorbuscha]XP_046151301.1 sushi repeat-containing protein SRPX2-like isoform X2 [Oncorhynchus gorbuscha]
MTDFRANNSVSLVSGSGTTMHSSYNEVVPEEEYYTPQLNYRNLRWCHFLTLANGDVTCHFPRGENYRSTLGTRCEMTCDRGYKLLGRSSVQCMPNRRWSGTSRCRQVRCNVLHLIWHGTYHCTQGYVVDSSCGYICELGYRIEGDHSRTCLDGGVLEWGRVHLCRCPVLKPPLHGYLTCDSDGNNYGAVCEYHCDRGQERRGISSRVCHFDHSWTEAPAECVQFKTDVDTASGLLDRFYEKRRLLIVSAPNVAHGDYKLQNLMVQKADCGLDIRGVTVIELLGSPPREVGHIKGRHLDTEVIEGLRQAFRILLQHGAAGQGWFGPREIPHTHHIR